MGVNPVRNCLQRTIAIAIAIAIAFTIAITITITARHGRVR